MLNRYTTALSLALLAVFASTGVASAAIQVNDRNDVMLVTGIAAVIAMVLLTIAYAVKHALGLDKMPPPEPDGGHGSGHH
jgi:amino acid transporter